MLDRLRDPLVRLRLTGHVEGLTLLVLFLVAMPLKYLYGVPEATRVAGAVHGVAFVAYLVVLADTAAGAAWRLREAMLALCAALVPFGTFVYNRRILGASPTAAARPALP